MFIINVSLKRMTSLLITPVPQSSVPGFAASKVGSPWLGVFFLARNKLCNAITLVKDFVKKNHGIFADDQLAGSFNKDGSPMVLMPRFRD